MIYDNYIDHSYFVVADIVLVVDSDCADFVNSEDFVDFEEVEVDGIASVVVDSLGFDVDDILYSFESLDFYNPYSLLEEVEVVIY